MKLVGKIPVEPLDDERLTNIERRIVANAGDRVPTRARRPWLAYAGALAAVAVAGVVGWKLHRAPAGSVAVVGDGTSDVIAVHTDAKRSVLDIGDATIESDPDTAFAITRPADGVLVDMQRGKVALAVGKRGSRAPLVVRAGETDVIVVGTRFSVDYHDGHGDPDVVVTEGVVRVVKRVQAIEVKVAAGHAWHRSSGVVAMSEVVAGAKIGEDESGAGSGSGSAGIEIEPMRDHVAIVPEAQLPQPIAHDAGSATAGGPEVSRKPPGIEPATDPHGPLKIEIRRVALLSPIDASEVDLKEPARVVAKYFDLLLHKKSPEDESRAMYGIAYVDAMKLGRSADALAMIKQFKSRFSNKHYAEYDSALWLEVRILCLEAHWGVAACRDAATRYHRDASPDAPGQAVARLITE